MNSSFDYIADAEAKVKPVFDRIDAVEEINTQTVLDAFREEKVSYRHFAPTTGYGYDDIGRDTLDRIFAKVLHTEDAIVRPQIVSGTHALVLAMQGILRPGDTILCASGTPYDTLEEAIGLRGQTDAGSLRDFGINCSIIDLTSDGHIDMQAVCNAVNEHTKLVHVQRSRGYAWRPALSVKEINALIDAVHTCNPNAIVFVDNCYGEFTQTEEPKADIMAGSLIKNLGGGIAPTGGYIAGRKDCIELVANRLTTPGIGREVGSYAASYQPFYQGLFMAPHTVAQALKTAVLTAYIFEKLGYRVEPSFDAPRNDIIQSIRFEDCNKLLTFVQEVQRCSPVDSNAIPEPWDMPGYQDPVIMAAGTFVAGASVELSADAPVRPPYIVYMQGSLTYAHGKTVVRNILRAFGY